MKKRFLSILLTSTFCISSFCGTYTAKAETSTKDKYNIENQTPSYVQFNDEELPDEEKEWLKNNIEETTDTNLNELGLQRSFGTDLLSIDDNNEISLEETIPLADTALPSQVDNSTLRAFPGIGNQRSLGSCTSFASTYYQMSHMVNLQRGRNGSLAENKCSPKWTYNLINYGSNNGSFISRNLSAIQSVGVASLKDFPYVGSTSPATNYREWASDASIWKKAQNYTIDKYSTINMSSHISGPKDSNLNVAKTKLANGYLLTFSTYWYSWVLDRVDDDPSTSSDDNYVGEVICKYNDDTHSGGHALTAVGYNDDIWVDINNNGTVDQGEKGAFKIANSWGTSYGNKGFYWLSYDALNKVSEVANNPSTTSGRQSTFKDTSGFYWFTPHSSSDSPKFFAQFTLNTAKRNQIYAEITATNKSTGVVNTFNPFALNYAGGAYAFDGTTTASDCSFVFNLSKVIPNLTEEELLNNTWTLSLKDKSNNSYPLIIKDFKIINDVSNCEYKYDLSSPVSINGTTKTFDINPTKKNTNSKVSISMAEQSTSTTANAIAPRFKITNTGQDSIALKDLKIKYYYSLENSTNATQSFVCYYSGINGLSYRNITNYILNTFKDVSTTNTTASKSAEFSFTSDAGTLEPGETIDLQVSINKSDWSNFDRSNDYSFNSTATDYAEWDKVTAYVNDSLVWGVEP